MARLESQAKLGYYPTPDHLIPIIASYISPLTQQGNILDPCCGEGDAISFLGLALAGRTYGIELDKGRFQLSRERLNTCIFGDAFRTKISNQSFSLLFLNPPYDWAVRNEEEDTQRTEHQFLLHFSPKLVSGGLLVFVVPFHILARSYVYLSNWYQDIRVCRFPAEDYEDFSQVVLFGKKKPKSLPDEFTRERLRAIGKGEIEPSELSLQETPIYTLPPSSPPAMFFSLDVEEDEAEEYSQTSSLWSDFWREMDAVETPSPIMPLRKGHLALLLAGGYLDGRLSDKGFDLVLKGSTHRVTERTEEIETDENGRETTVIREVDKVEVSILALDLTTGIFHEIK